MVVTRSAKNIIAVISIVLLAPICLMGLQSQDALMAFHNRSLASWPSFFHYRRTPSAYFDDVNRWISDRVYPSVALNALRNDLTFYVLRQSPSPNITMGRDGLTFLNGTDAGHENNLVTSSCVDASDPAHLTQLEAALRRIAMFGRLHGYRIDVLMVPTIPILYGDRLPSSIASSLRDACAASYAHGGPVGSIAVPEGMHFVYPFAELKALRDDAAMYPNGNYHASGLSVRTATNAYLRSIGATQSSTAMTSIEHPSEVLESRGMEVQFPQYAAVNGETTSDADRSASLANVTEPYRDDPGQVVSLYVDPTAPNAEAVFVLSDSFGTNQGADLSSAFTLVAQMQTPHRDVAKMIDGVYDVIHFSRLLLVFNDTNLTRLSQFGERLSLLPGH